jgi:hypothetical protein
VARRIPVPCLANLVEGGKGVAPTQAQLHAMGYGIALHANIALRAAMRAVQDILGYLREHGSPAGAEDRFATWQERQALVKLDEYQDLERRYAAASTDDINDRGTWAHHLSGALHPPGTTVRGTRYNRPDVADA